MYRATIKTLPAMSLIALAHRGDYREIGARFEQLAAWAGARGLLDGGSRWFGAYYDDPATTPVADLRSDACLLAAEGAGGMIEAPMRTLTLPAGRYACVVHRGPYIELEGAYRWLYGEWLPVSGETPADGPCSEEYLNDCRASPPSDWLTEIRLPLRG